MSLKTPGTVSRFGGEPFCSSTLVLRTLALPFGFTYFGPPYFGPPYFDLPYFGAGSGAPGSGAFDSIMTIHRKLSS
jgi:hypothetical protein